MTVAKPIAESAQPSRRTAQDREVMMTIALADVSLLPLDVYRSVLAEPDPKTPQVSTDELRRILADGSARRRRCRGPTSTHSPPTWQQAHERMSLRPATIVSATKFESMPAAQDQGAQRSSRRQQEHARTDGDRRGCTAEIPLATNADHEACDPVAAHCGRNRHCQRIHRSAGSMRLIVVTSACLRSLVCKRYGSKPVTGAGPVVFAGTFG